jgi:hypothetical protein
MPHNKAQQWDVWSKNSSVPRYQHLLIYCLCHNAFEFCLRRGLELNDKFELMVGILNGLGAHRLGRKALECVGW